MLEEKQPAGGLQGNLKMAGQRAENRRKVSERGGCLCLCHDSEDADGGGKQRPSLSPAGAVGDVVCGERIAEAIQFSQPFRGLVGGRYKRERRPAQLLKAGLQERNETGFRIHLALLPGCFETRRVGEASRWKGRVSQLPKQPIAGCRSRRPGLRQAYVFGVGTARPQYLEAWELGTSRPHPAQEWSLTRA
jgi:hypothetical protein